MGTLIETADRAQIEALAADGSTAAIRRRAQLLLLYDEGLPTREVAEQIDLSLSRTRFWRRRYIFEGMQIFAESSLKTAPSVPSITDQDQLTSNLAADTRSEDLEESEAIEVNHPQPEQGSQPIESELSQPVVEIEPAEEEPLQQWDEFGPIEEQLGEPAEDNEPIEDVLTETIEERELFEEELPEPAEDDELFEGTPAEPEEELESQPISLAELRQRYPANLRRAEHRRDLALELFDATQVIHQLPDEQRRLLEVAALLQYLTESQEDESSNKSGYLFILSHPLTDLSEVENKIVEAVLGYQHGKVVLPASWESDHTLSPAEHEALILAAILRIAHGLDASQSQETMIDSIEIDPQELKILVSGPKAKKDARIGRKSAKLWSRLFEQKVHLEAVYLLDLAGDKKLESLLMKKNPGVNPDDSLSEAGRKVMGYHFAQMLRHEAGTRKGEDIEELHDMRVATRRMRAAFEVFSSAFETKAVKTHLKGLRATGRALGRVRDLDVFMEKAQHYLDTIPQEQRTGLEPLLTLWENERQTDREKMLEHLNSESYANFKSKFLRFVSTSNAGAKKVSVTSPNQVRHIVPALVYTRLASVRAYGLILESATIEQLHGLRIEFKKLRYTLEFFREVLGGETKDLVGEIKTLQDHLGDLNDADVACQILRQFLDEWESRQVYKPISERDNPEPIVAYLAAKHAERYFLTTNFQEAWQAFDGPEMRANLASAVSVL
jgi:CHAD domain-containing protein